MWFTFDLRYWMAAFAPFAESLRTFAESLRTFAVLKN
jgi:hypothetical protein